MDELTVLWEDNVQESFERKKVKYEELRLQCSEHGWMAYCFPFEVSYRGFIAQSTVAFIRFLGVGGCDMSKVCKDLKEAAKSGSGWIFVRRDERGEDQ